MAIVIARDASQAQAISGSSAPLAFNYTMGSAAGGLLMVNVVASNVSSFASPTATWNGVSMTNISQITQGIVTQVIFQLLGPATGTHSLSINWTGSGGLISTVAASYTGVRQYGGEGTASGHSNSSNTGTTHITTSADNAWVIFLPGLQDGTSLTPGANTVSFGGNSNGAWWYDTNAAITPPQQIDQSASWTGSKDWVVFQLGIAPVYTQTFLVSDNIPEFDVETMRFQRSFTVTDTSTLIDLLHTAKIAIQFVILNVITTSDTVSFFQKWIHAIAHSATWTKATKAVTAWTKQNKS